MARKQLGVAASNATDAVTKGGAENLTSKTLTSPIISGDLLPDTNNTRALGDGSHYWNSAAIFTVTSPMIRLPDADFSNVVDVVPPSVVASNAVVTLPGTTDTLVGRNTTDTLTGKTLTDPKVNGIYDTNGNPMVGFAPAASAVNYFQWQNGATTAGVWLSSVGTDSAVPIVFSPKGGAAVVRWVDSGSTSTLSALGSATNIDWNITGQGTGVVKANGVEVATISGTQDLTGKRETLAAGSATVAPLKFTSGTNLTTAAAGAVEYDGTVFYLTPAASTRHVNDVEQFITLTSAYTLANQTAVQKLFNSPTNGAVTLVANCTYFFECCFTLTGLNASSHSVGFALGGTVTLTRQAWWADAMLGALATTGTLQRTYNTAANTTLVTAGTNTNFSATIKGKIVVGTGGTLIPQVSQLTNAAAAIVGVDSYFRIWTVGSNTVQSVGNWS